MEYYAVQLCPKVKELETYTEHHDLIHKYCITAVKERIQISFLVVITYRIHGISPFVL